MLYNYFKGIKPIKPGAILLLAVIAILASCTPQSRLTYFQDSHQLGDHLEVEIEAYRLKPGDILHVRVMSADPEAYDIFNLDDTRRFTTRTGDVGDQQMYLYGYTINTRGEIQLPVIGHINVAGQTLDQVHQTIQQRAEEYIVDATVSVKIVNFSVTVLGEVNRPGSYYVYDHEFTLMDALGLAGDLTDYGNREVHIARRTDNGMEFARLNITDRQAMTSELFYLQPNDIIYVEPLIAKRFGFAQFPFSVLFSAISSTLLLINFFR